MHTFTFDGGKFHKQTNRLTFQCVTVAATGPNCPRRLQRFAFRVFFPSLLQSPPRERRTSRVLRIGRRDYASLRPSNHLTLAPRRSRYVEAAQRSFISATFTSFFTSAARKRSGCGRPRRALFRVRAALFTRFTRGSSCCCARGARKHNGAGCLARRPNFLCRAGPANKSRLSDSHAS